MHAALEVLGNAPGATVRADTALEAARKALMLLQWGLVQAAETGSDHLTGVVFKKPSGD
jgi:hypothetical protein